MKALALLFSAFLMQGMPSAVFGGLPDDFAAALERAGVKPQQVSIWFGEADSAEARFHWLPETPRNPASVLKLITTAQALDTLGPQYRWSTTVWAEGPLRPMRCKRADKGARCGGGDSTLEGRLLLSGGGDPRLRREDLRALFSQVRAAGIRHISGGIGADVVGALWLPIEGARVVRW